MSHKLAKAKPRHKLKVGVEWFCILSPDEIEPWGQRSVHADRKKTFR
jgi:hypothetical protein